MMSLDDSVQLPCGLSLPNRLVKAPMEEMLATFGGGNPTLDHFFLYLEWARGHWGMLLTGNVMVDARHLGTPFDVTVPPRVASSAQQLAADTAYRLWSTGAHGQTIDLDSSTVDILRLSKDDVTRLRKAAAEGSVRPSAAPLVVMQLCHPGRQSCRGSGRSPLEPALAPSAVPVRPLGSSFPRNLISAAMFGTPKEMTQSNIDTVIESFVRAAKQAKNSGFDGVELHCSHGYLLAQFLSPNVNKRTDRYGGSARNRITIVFEIIDAIRKEFPSSESRFALGIKLNSSDYVKGGLTEKDALENVKWIAEHGGVDFIEISGGTYENPAFMLDDDCSTPSSSSTLRREAFFLSFSRQAHELLQSLPPSDHHHHPYPLLVLTGGFRSRQGMQSALQSSSTDLIGIGRPACLDPHFANKILNPTIPDQDAIAQDAYAPAHSAHQSLLYRVVRSLGFHRTVLLPGLETLYCTLMLNQIARGYYTPLDTNQSFVGALSRVLAQRWFPSNFVQRSSSTGLAKW